MASRLDDRPVYNVKCPPSPVKNKAKCCMLHQYRLMLVPLEDITEAQDDLHVHPPTGPNPNIDSAMVRTDSSESGSKEPVSP